MPAHPDRNFLSERMGEWTQPRLKRCAHSRAFPQGSDRDDQCSNVAEFMVLVPQRGQEEPLCGLCLAPVIKMLHRRYGEIVVRRGF